MAVRAKRFRPPLKSNTVPGNLSPGLSSAPTSQSNNSDSLPCTQTHTVLSYCDNYQEDEEEHSNASSEADQSQNSVSEESEAEVPSRFKRHTPYPLPPKSYGHRAEQQKRRQLTVADLEQSLRRKRVKIRLPVRTGVGQRVCGGDLSVYDCQPTPPDKVGVVNNSISRQQSEAEQVSQHC